MNEYRKWILRIILLQRRVPKMQNDWFQPPLFKSCTFAVAYEMQNLKQIEKSFDPSSPTFFRFVFRPHDAKHSSASFRLECPSGQKILSTTKCYAQKMFVFLCVYMSIWNNDYVNLDVFLAPNVSVFTKLKVDVVLDFKISSFIVLCILDGHRTQ